MNIVVLGLMFTDQSLKNELCYSKTGVQMQVHLFNSKIVTGLKQLENVDLTVYSVPPSGSFPIHHKKLIVRSNKYDQHIELGFLNLPIIKHKIQQYKLQKRLKKELKRGEEVYVVIYTLYPPYINAIKNLKKKYKNLRVSLIQTDPIPGANDIRNNTNRRAEKRGNRLIRLSKNIDKFILLTKYLAEMLQIEEKPYLIVDCICDEKQKVADIATTGKNICLYSGTTEIEYGICDLVDAFKEIPEAELWICGRGPADAYIRLIGEECPNIKHMGFVDQEKLTELRDKCDFLINPRRPTGTYTKYSFPSKTAEYLMSGKPCIMYKLEGVSDEYDRYLNYLTADKPEDIAKELKQIFAMDYQELVKKGAEGIQFMFAEKSSKKQAERILEFLRT